MSLETLTLKPQCSTSHYTSISIAKSIVFTDQSESPSAAESRGHRRLSWAASAHEIWPHVENQQAVPCRWPQVSHVTQKHHLKMSAYLLEKNKNMTMSENICLSSSLLFLSFLLCFIFFFLKAGSHTVSPHWPWVYSVSQMDSKSNQSILF